MRPPSQIAPQLDGGEVVILESTSPPGTTMLISQWLADLRPDLTSPAHAVDRRPRRLRGALPRARAARPDHDRDGHQRPGRRRHHADAARRRPQSIYRVFCQGEILLTDAASAEMAKLVENAYRDVNIAFANELSLICESPRARRLGGHRAGQPPPAGQHPHPGPGVGGHCIAVDPWFIVGAAPELSRLIRTAREVNDAQAAPRRRAGHRQGRTRFRDPTVACLGLAFKANVDDLRESPAVDIVVAICEGPCPTSTPCSRSSPTRTSCRRRLQGRPNLRLVRPERSRRPRPTSSSCWWTTTTFRSSSRTRLAGKVVYDTRGFWR